MTGLSWRVPASFPKRYPRHAFKVIQILRPSLDLGNGHLEISWMGQLVWALLELATMKIGVHKLLHESIIWPRPPCLFICLRSICLSVSSLAAFPWSSARFSLVGLPLGMNLGFSCLELSLCSLPLVLDLCLSCWASMIGMNYFIMVSAVRQLLLCFCGLLGQISLGWVRNKTSRKL